jgi:hypothetical protein
MWFAGPYGWSVRGSCYLTAAARRALGQGVGRWEGPTPGRGGLMRSSSRGSADGGINPGLRNRLGALAGRHTWRGDGTH